MALAVCDAYSLLRLSKESVQIAMDADASDRTRKLLIGKSFRKLSLLIHPDKNVLLRNHSLPIAKRFASALEVGGKSINAGYY
jgi:hypothetical protein